MDGADKSKHCARRFPFFVGHGADSIIRAEEKIYGVEDVDFFQGEAWVCGGGGWGSAPPPAKGLASFGILGDGGREI